MIIKFIKDHPTGIQEGRVQEVSPKFGNRMISEGYAEEGTQTDLGEFRKSIEDAKKDSLAEFEAKQAEELKAKQEAEANTIKTKDSDCGCGQNHEGEGKCEKCEAKEKELSSLTKTEIQKIAKENNFPEEEWKSLNKEPLIEYVAPKLVSLENK